MSTSVPPIASVEAAPGYPVAYAALLVTDRYPSFSL
jgi:hypothetical protein